MRQRIQAIQDRHGLSGKGYVMLNLGFGDKVIPLFFCSIKVEIGPTA
jgi:hypothetical protein